MIDAINNIFYVTLARCGQQYFVNASGFKVLCQACLVAPDAGIIDDNCIFNAVCFVVDVTGVTGVNDFDSSAIRDNRLVRFIYLNRSFEAAMNGISAQ